MVYGSRSHYEDNPTRDQLVAEQSAQKNKTAADKVAKFFEDNIGADKVTRGPCSHASPVRIEIAPAHAGFAVRHRGHSITVHSTDQPDLESQFRAWCAKEMPHAKVFPRKKVTSR